MTVGTRNRLVFLSVLAVVFLAAYAFRFPSREPLAALPPAMKQVEASGTIVAVREGRRLESVVLDAGTLGEVRLAVSFPEPMPEGPLPVLIVLGGLPTGAENLSLIPEAGNNVLVGYDWPISVAPPKASTFLLQAPGLYRDVMRMPGQGATAIVWAAGQPWADGRRVSLLGFSMGALAAPAVQRLAEQAGQPVGWTILAYGGAPLSALLASNPNIQPEWLRHVLGGLAGFLLGPLEPEAHLPYVRGNFLVLEGTDDELITAEARARLRDAVPEPKDIVTFPGDHMSGDVAQRAHLQRIMAASRDWLIRQGAINAP